MKLTDSTMATADPKSVRTFIKRAKVSTTSDPPNASCRPLPPASTSATASPRAMMAAMLTISADLSRNTPNIRSAIAATTRKISGSAAAPWI